MNRIVVRDESRLCVKWLFYSCLVFVWIVFILCFLFLEGCWLRHGEECRLDGILYSMPSVCLVS